MKKVVISDVSLKVFEAKKQAVSFREMLQAAQLLEQAGVDAIELPPLVREKEDAVICRTIAGALKRAQLCVPVGMTQESLKLAWQAVSGAVNPCLQVVLPISTVQMEYLYHKKAPKMLETLAELCKSAAALCSKVEFVAQDASRAEEGFLAQCCKTAQENGATAVTICDDGGICFPEDAARMVQEVKQVCGASVFVQPSDALNMAAACAVAAIQAGADGVKTAADAEYLEAGTLANIFRAKEGALPSMSGLDVTAVHKIFETINGGGAAAPATFAVPNELDTMQLDASCTMSEISELVQKLGYELSDEDTGKVYEEFKRVVRKKEFIGVQELEAVVATAAMQVPSTFHVVSYVVNSGNIIEATANVTLERDGEKLSGVSTGDGPIDAAFHAIEQIVGYHYELDDFQIQAVTKGREAVGSSLIRLRADGKLYSGSGVSTDIVGACIRAYINALNKIVYEEN